VQQTNVKNLIQIYVSLSPFATGKTGGYKMDFGKISQGQNEFENRDVLTFTMMYGQLERWVSKPLDSNIPVIKDSNMNEIEVGSVVKITDIAFVKWQQLITMVDRSEKRKYDNHVKRSMSSISEELGYSYKGKKIYKIFKPLYEVGLIDIKETKYRGKTVTDIIVYPYPVYADSKICSLVKCRKWSDRRSFGLSLAKKSIESRNKNIEVSEKTPDTVSEKTPDTVSEKTPDTVSEKTPDTVSEKTPSNNNNYLSDYNNLRDHNHLNELSAIYDESTLNLIDRFMSEKIDDDDISNLFVEQLSKYKTRAKTEQGKLKYMSSVLSTVKQHHKEQKDQKRSVRRDNVPEYIATSNNKSVAHGDQLQVDHENIEERARKLEEKLKSFGKKKTSGK